MSPGRYWIRATILLLLLLTIGQDQTVSSFRARDLNGLPMAEAQPAMAILSVPANKSIVVNGALAIAGATILSGATVETSNQTLATIAFVSCVLRAICPT